MYAGRWVSSRLSCFFSYTRPPVRRPPRFSTFIDFMWKLNDYEPVRRRQSFREFAPLGLCRLVTRVVFQSCSVRPVPTTYGEIGTSLCARKCSVVIRLTTGSAAVCRPCTQTAKFPVEPVQAWEWLNWRRCKSTPYSLCTVYLVIIFYVCTYTRATMTTFRSTHP